MKGATFPRGSAPLCSVAVKLMLARERWLVEGKC